ncbi:hypothetical protein AB5I41_25780 [Sphingomonas sp. MMS24-JH45]
MKKPLAALLSCLAAAASAQVYQPPRHTQPAPQLGADPQAEADKGIDVERDRTAPWLLAEHRRLAATLAALKPQRPGTIDAYVVVAGLDSDAVFGREARAAAAVLSRRYGAQGRTILLAGSDGGVDSTYPMGSPTNLALALARVAEVMDPKEDVLVLYTTSHGAGFGRSILQRRRPGLWRDLADAAVAAIVGTRHPQPAHPHQRLLFRAFVPDAVVGHDRDRHRVRGGPQLVSGCQADNDWTFFGDALVNTALRKPQPLAAAGQVGARHDRAMGGQRQTRTVPAAGRDRPRRRPLARRAGSEAAPRGCEGRSPRDRVVEVISSPARSIRSDRPPDILEHAGHVRPDTGDHAQHGGGGIRKRWASWHSPSTIRCANGPPPRPGEDSGSPGNGRMRWRASSKPGTAPGCNRSSS